MIIPAFDSNRNFLFDLKINKKNYDKAIKDLSFMNWQYYNKKDVNFKNFSKSLIKNNLPLPEKVVFVDKNDIPRGILLSFREYLTDNYLSVFIKNEKFEVPISKSVKNLINGFETNLKNPYEVILAEINKFLKKNKLSSISYFHFKNFRDLELFVEKIHHFFQLAGGIYIYLEIAKNVNETYIDDFQETLEASIKNNLEDINGKKVNKFIINIEGQQIELYYKSVAKLYEILEQSIPIIPDGDIYDMPGYYPFEYI